MSGYSWRWRRRIAATERKWIHENNSRRNEIRRHGEIKLIRWRVPYPAFFRECAISFSIRPSKGILTSWLLKPRVPRVRYSTMWSSMRNNPHHVLDKNQGQLFDIKSAIGIKYEYWLLSSARRIRDWRVPGTLRSVVANLRYLPRIHPTQ